MSFALDFFDEIASLPGDVVLDVGAGSAVLANNLEGRGKEVWTVDLRKLDRERHFYADFMEASFRITADVVVASHVLEHVLDTGLFLHRVLEVMDGRGWFVCIVPPAKPEIVGGHVHLYTMGLLVYQLILCGFDGRNGHFKRRGYSIAAFVQPSEMPLPALIHDNGDIERLAEHWPPGIDPVHGFNGEIDSLNWPEEWA